MPELRSLLERFVPELEIRSLRAIESGWSSHVLDVNNDWIFRVPRTARDRRAMERAAAFYPFLASKVPVPIPHYSFQSRTRSGRLRFVGYRKLRGRSLPETRLGRPAAKLWKVELARALRALHAIPPREGLAAGLPRYDPVAARRGRLRQYRSFRGALWPRLTSSERRRDEAAWEAFQADPRSFRIRVTAVHGDLYPSHILTAPGREGLRGVLDWEDACLGDPASDLALLPLSDGFARGVWALCPELDESAWHRARIKGHAAFGSNAEYWGRRGEMSKLRGWIRRYVDTIP